MTNTLSTVVITVAIVAFVLYRNLTWQSVSLAKLTRMPIVFVLVGFATVAGTVRSLGAGWYQRTTDVVVLGAELVTAVVVGWAMGRLSELGTVGGKVCSRLRPVGPVVFLGFVALRVAVAFLAASIGVTPALMSSSVLIVIAAIKLTQSLVVRKAYAAHTLSDAPQAAQSTLTLR